MSLYAYACLRPLVRDSISGAGGLPGSWRPTPGQGVLTASAMAAADGGGAAWARVRHADTAPVAAAAARGVTRSRLAALLLAALLAAPAAVLLGTAALGPRAHRPSSLAQAQTRAQILRAAAEQASVADAGAADAEENLLSDLPDINPHRVLVKMYMEGECAVCRKFTSTFLPPILNASGLSELVDFAWVAWGHAAVDAEERGNWTAVNTANELKRVLHGIDSDRKSPPPVNIQCLHGEDECERNAWYACLLEVQPDHKKSFPVFQCMESDGCDELDLNATKSSCEKFAGATAKEVQMLPVFAGTLASHCAAEVPDSSLFCSAWISSGSTSTRSS